MGNAAFDELQSVLEHEAEVLKLGELEHLPVLAERKTKAWNALEEALRSPGALPDITPLRTLALRNAHLLVASRAGLAKANAQIKRAKDPAKKMSTYAADGRKHLIGSTNRQIDTLL